METTKYLLGQVGGFPLRLSWLPRAYARYAEKGSIPRNVEEVSCDLGIGKNMVKSLRIWGQASGMIGENGNFKPLAKRIFERDPYFESIESIALLHWFICSNLESFTVNTWLFNYYHVGQFTVKQAVDSFREFLVATGEKYAVGTVQVDIETTMRMYAGMKERSIFDMDDKFLHPLGLLTSQRVEGKSVFSRTWETKRYLVSNRVLSYAVLSNLVARRIDKTTLSDLYYSSMSYASPGSVFGFTKDGFFSSIEKIVHDDRKKFSLTSLPGGDFQLTVLSTLSKKCKQGDMETAEEYCFSKGK